MTQKTFLEYYKLPLLLDPCTEETDATSIVFTQDMCRAFDITSPSQVYTFQDIIDKINGVSNSVKYRRDSLIHNVSSSTIMGNDNLIISVRGWGHLTGTCNLTDEQAKQIQDDFVEYIIDMLVL